MRYQDRDNRLATQEFSIVDAETTGLFPDHGDRIVEIAVVRVDFTGKLIDLYSTLVNPHRDLGPTYIHHISPSDVLDAPSFEEVAGDVLSRVGGAVFTGFNAYFDLRFLRAEIRRLGHDIPPSEPLCVMRLAGKVAPNLPGRKLDVCCRYFGVPLSGAHSAHNDALATAKLLSQCLAHAENNCPEVLRSLPFEPLPSKDRLWPGIRISGKSFSRTDATLTDIGEPSYMEHLVASLPSMARVDSRLDEYLTLLDRVIEDRVLTEAEATLLLTQAREAGLSQELVQEAHSQYMRDLLRAALADGTITERENQDLRKVNGLLAIPESQFETLVRGAIAEHVVGLEDGRLKAEPKQACSGLTVCFTGTLMGRIGCQPISRQQAEQLAAERGMIIKRGVSRDLDLLVAADPKSMSGKANKARHLGIRIVAEQAFWRMLGISVD